MRKQYHFWPADPGFDAWDVDQLIERSRDLPVEPVAVASISEIDTAYWFEGITVEPTVRNVVEHARLMLRADLSYPVILGYDGRVMDGMHRGDKRRALPVPGCSPTTAAFSLTSCRIDQLASRRLRHPEMCGVSGSATGNLSP